MSDSAPPGPYLSTRKRSPYLLWSIWVIWLPFCTPAIVQLLQSHPTQPHLVATLAGAALFIGIYLWITLRNAHRLVTPTAAGKYAFVPVWLSIVALTALSLILVISNGPIWGSMFIFTVACAAGSLPTLQAALVLIALELMIVIGTWHGHFNWADVAPGLGYVAVVGVVVMSVRRSVATERELRAAREEIESLAVMTERLRIARDLHDLLGHNLSLIALKSELARRLLSVAPERAAIEIGDVESVARTTLEEVREAVTNYRQPTLANELHAASEILAAAGIAYRYQGDENNADTLPTPLEAVLSWTVREGVTNVIRHSHARQCVIQVTRDKQRVGVEVLDDGQETATLASAATSGHGGNGLRGLKERVVTLGGACEMGVRATGGFRLAVFVPLAHKHLQGTPASFALSSQSPQVSARLHGPTGVTDEKSEKAR